MKNKSDINLWDLLTGLVGTKKKDKKKGFTTREEYYKWQGTSKARARDEKLAKERARQMEIKDRRMKKQKPYPWER